MFNSRTKAAYAIKLGLIFSDGKQIIKARTFVNEDSVIEIRGSVNPYVSKGGLKLVKAINEFKINLEDKTMVDIGSSTGGFTDVALKNNVKKVIAVDVGSNQMDSELKNNKKLELYEQTDFRNINNNILKEVNIATIDVSFISVAALIPKLNTLPNLKEIICLIKPEFEVGKEVATKYHGVITNSNIHEKVIIKILNEFKAINFNIDDLTYSPIKGGSGNI